MATVRAVWKRTVRVKEYESETLELMVEKDYTGHVDYLVAEAVNLDRDLARAGDALVAARLCARVDAKDAPCGNERRTPPSPVSRTSKPIAPDVDPLV